MTEDLHDEEYLDLFKPKTDTSAESASPTPEPGGLSQPGETEPAQPVGVESSLEAEALDSSDLQADSTLHPPKSAEQSREDQGRSEPQASVPRFVRSERDIKYEPLLPDQDRVDRTLRSIGMFLGGGCLLLVLVAIVVFAFFQVFVRKGDDGPRGTPTPTLVIFNTLPPPTATATESPLLVVPLVSSEDVRVPVALPERLTIGETVFTVQAVETPTGSWPEAPTTDDVASWAYGTVVNYILGLAPTSRNEDLVSLLQVGDSLSLYMSTGLILNFNVSEIATGATDELALFEQISPRLTLAFLSTDPTQRIVVTAAFFSDEAGDRQSHPGAVIGLVGTPVDQGPTRVTVIETYQVGAEEARLPQGAGYLLMDISVENVGTGVLEPEFFQTYLSDSTGERYPLTILAEQFTHYGIPQEPLGPGEKVIGSLGYLVTGGPKDQIQWAFNPQPGSDHWVVVPVSYDLPPAAPTLPPPPPVGFARVTVSTDDVFVNRGDGLLDIGLAIENISEGVVQVTEEDISLTSWTDAELSLVAPAPMLPWTIGPGDVKLFQLQFELPSADSALLSVLGYTFSIENLGRE